MKQKIKDEIMWQSHSENFGGEPFFKVRVVNDWYVYGERLGKDSIAFILFDENAEDGKHYALINERKPAMNARYDREVFMTTAFGGSNDSDHSFEEITQKEVKEESGYSVDLNRITSLGSVLVSTQMNQMCYLYMVNVTDLQKGERELGMGEQGSEVIWMSEKAIYLGQDWKATTILTKYKNNIEG